MRKIICMLLAGLLLGLCACGDITTPASGDETSATAAQLATTQPETSPENTEAASCEIIMLGLAKTSTHYYTPTSGGILRAPVDDIAAQETLPLPDRYEGLALSGAELCGITEDWLFVNLWEAREIRRETEVSDGEEIEVVWEDYENRRAVTFRIALDSWEAEALLTESIMTTARCHGITRRGTRC